jgi:hypothetical protein
MSYHENLERWLYGMKEDTKDQALRFLLSSDDPREIADNAGFIKLQIAEFNRMYPESG